MPVLLQLVDSLGVWRRDMLGMQEVRDGDAQFGQQVLFPKISLSFFDVNPDVSGKVSSLHSKSRPGFSAIRVP